jgi:flagellar hook-associated protein 1
MSLTALNAALTGLRIAQQQIGVISNNVANVGTPGYTRKILPQQAQVIEGHGRRRPGQQDRPER